MKRVHYINGRFLGRPVTGVERFAEQLLRQLNDSVADPEDYVVLVPAGIARPLWLDRIGFRSVGGGRGHIWEQTALYAASRKGILVNLCNSGPVLHRRSLVVVHDAWVYRHPDHFTASYRLFHQGLGRLLARRARLATVSHFSRQELAEIFAIPAHRIAVISNSADHLSRIVPDDAVLTRLGCTPKSYLLLVGSFAPNKNMPRAIRAFVAVARADERLLVVGAPVGVFANDDLSMLPPNVTLAGRVPDAELAALYRDAAGLLFPSLYEGFGIPPLEAMHFGVPVLASDIAVVQEVCSDAAVYYDATDDVQIGASIRKVMDDPVLLADLSTKAKERAADFSWSRSLDQLMASLVDL